MNKSLIKIEEEIYTHEYLWRSSTELYNLAITNSERAFFLLMPSLLMAYLAYEAFLNFAGYALNEELWRNEKETFKGKTIEYKLEIIIKMIDPFNWIKDSGPYQSIKRLERFRTIITHGKVLKNKYAAMPRPDGSHFTFAHLWDEYATIESVNKFRNDIKEFTQAIIDCAKTKSDHPHFIFNAYEGNLADANGE